MDTRRQERGTLGDNKQTWKGKEGAEPGNYL